MKVVFFGTPQFAVPTLAALLDRPEFEVLAVVTQPDKRRGRGTAQIPSPVKQLAITHGLPVWQPQRLKKDPLTLENLRATQADAFVVVAYGQLLSPEILAMPRWGCVNVHGSLLPKYRGAAPIQWSLYYGDAETGITTMLMDAGMDTGAMLLTAKTPIGLLDTATDLAVRLSQMGADLLIETLLQHQNLQPIPQDATQATYAPLIQKVDYSLDWSRSAIELHNQIRGFFPNCTTSFRGGVLKVSRTVPLLPEILDGLPTKFAALSDLSADFLASEPSTVNPGSVVGVLKSWGPVIQTGAGWLLLQEVQLSGKRPQVGWDFANGSRLQVGELLSEKGSQ